MAINARAVQLNRKHINSPKGRCGMDLDKDHYEEVWRSEDGRDALYCKKREYCPPEVEAEIMHNFAEAYYRLFDGLSPEAKFEIFERDGCEALINGEWQDVERDYYIKALGLEGKEEVAK